ncbi:hypothetical protein BIY29_17670 [Brenneria alni]|uniref:Uncharacterized protein n=1 Tax=Brenneria alni TaxID=71656 RepID=A0A421DJK0_9GAMM|nr:hypothetical protein [Brenneria alni]RLM18817.1 hypothetical protein BIY29_17670 [Brenneria alni]
MNNLINRLARSRHSIVDLLVLISEIEGQLMVAEAFNKLGINSEHDDGDLTSHDYRVFNIAHDLGEALYLDFIPESYRVHFDDVISLGMKVGEGYWQPSFQNGLNEAAHTLSELSNEGQDVDEYIEYLAHH